MESIVGGGIAGIACSWELQKHHCAVDIYESDSKLGGHANSVPFKGNGKTVNVDSGFIAMDVATYPQFNAFLGELDVKTIPTDMSFGVSTTDGTFDWSSYSLLNFIGTFSRLLKPWFWRLMFDILRFTLFAEDVLVCDTQQKEATESFGTGTYDDVFKKDVMEEPLESIGDYLKRQGYSERFIDYYLIPMVAAPWCTDPDEFARTFPAKSLIQFMLRCGILDTVIKRLQWRSFQNGSRTYVEAFQRSLPSCHQLHLNTPVQKVVRIGKKVSLIFSDHSSETFDRVVLAIHANQALALLGDGATVLERKYLPRRLSARAAWNCFLENNSKSNKLGAKKGFLMQNHSEKSISMKISITFDMNKLQAIPYPGELGSPGRVLVTMNPVHRYHDGALIDPHSVQSTHVYYHPLISSESVLMSRHINLINGVTGIAFAGAWMGFGFHEDGFRAGVNAARILIHGREKTPPLDLTADTEFDCVVRTGFLRRILKAIVSIVWQFV
ncbi:hypothetical protein M434DRAFT_34947 [Hypoxylon sp. CO27-5]|nr:hypothetical protein M434DRAFT_34947 [Hypoxylon sp. CO27-5]